MKLRQTAKPPDQDSLQRDATERAFAAGVAYAASWADGGWATPPSVDGRVVAAPVRAAAARDGARVRFKVLYERLARDRAEASYRRVLEGWCEHNRTVHASRRVRRQSRPAQMLYGWPIGPARRGTLTDRFWSVRGSLDRGQCLAECPPTVPAPSAMPAVCRRRRGHRDEHRAIDGMTWRLR